MAHVTSVHYAISNPFIYTIIFYFNPVVWGVVDFFAFINLGFVLKLKPRENMKLFKRFLLLALCAIPTFAQGQIATTAGSNLTAWNGNSGSTNNNNWNQLMNNRTLASGGGTGAVADFGNCNSLILRCAQPKCAGCTTIDIARPIVTGCVNSNASCKKYGDDLIEFISAQMVSNANSKAQQAEIAAQQMAAQQAAAQSNAQLQQMQSQMQQMQYEMQQQNAQQMAQMQAALDEQKALTAAAMEQAAKQPEVSAPVASGNGALTDDMIAAAERGVDADILARKQISGQILSKIENAEVALKKLKGTMDTAFTYAKCDARGNNCAGPKRVKMFKEKAHAFFEPYDEIVDEAYEALEMALAVGVDVSDVIMMLSGGCNQWGKFLCTGDNKGVHTAATYNSDTCKNGRSVKYGTVKGGQECSVGMAVPPQDDNRCTVTQLIGGAGDNDEVLREWLDENWEGDRLVRVGCATSALESIAIFGRRSSKRGATLDLDTLERIILQDAPDYVGGNRFTGGSVNDTIDRVKYCTLTQSGYNNLLAAVQSKKLPKRICVPHDNLRYVAEREAGVVSVDGVSNSEVYLSKADAEKANSLVPGICTDNYENKKEEYWKCSDSKGGHRFYGTTLLTDYEFNCMSSNGYLITARKCECDIGTHADEKGKCVADDVQVTYNYKEEAEKCEYAGGTYSATKAQCMCGEVPMDYKIQSCKDKTQIVSKK